MREIELKLVLASEGASVLAASDILAGEPKSEQLDATYFDTPKRKLAKNGISLRLRRSGGKTIQTVKADAASAAGLFDRNEWEQEVSGQEPVSDPRTPVAAMLGEDPAELAPAFTIEVERRTWQFEAEGSAIEFVLDSGHARAGDQQSPISEVELELRGGPVAGLFTLARRLDEITPVRVGVLTKAERGWLLVDDQQKAFKAEAVLLSTDTTTAGAFQRICLSCIRQFRLNEDLWLSTPSPDALHQARVAIRRLRSALTSFKRLAAQDERKAELGAELRWLAFELGEARNLDVLLEKAETEELRHQLSDKRTAAYDQVETVLGSPRARLLFLDLIGWLHQGKWLQAADLAELRERPSREFAGDVLDRLRRRIKKDRAVLLGAEDEPRHELRKDAKKLRYAAEFFTPLFREKKEISRRKKFLAALTRLQDDLGALNDLAMAHEVFEYLDIAAEPDAMVGSGEKDALIASAAEALDELLSLKPFWRQSAKIGGNPAGEG